MGRVFPLARVRNIATTICAQTAITQRYTVQKSPGVAAGTGTVADI